MCKYCNKHFSSVYTLKNHLNSAKYCLAKRSKTNVKQSNFLCKHCGNTFTQNKSLQTHLLTCKNIVIEKEQYELTIEESKNTIHDLQISLENANKLIHKLELELAAYKGEIKGLKTAKPTTIKNNSNITYINPKLANIPVHNIEPLTIEYIREENHRYTYNLFTKGPIGIVEFLDPLIRVYDEDHPDAKPCRNYVCTDIPRNKYHKYIASGEWKLDGGAAFLKEIFAELKIPAMKHYAKIQKKDKKLTNIAMDTFDPLDLAASKEMTDLSLKIGPMYRGICNSGMDRDKLSDDVRFLLKDIVGI